MGDAYSEASGAYDREQMEAFFIKKLTAYLQPDCWQGEAESLFSWLESVANNRSGSDCYRWDFGKFAWLYRDFSAVAAKLKEGDQKNWARLLAAVDDIQFAELKKISPWADKVLLIVHYDHRDGRGDFKYALARLIKERKSWPVGRKVLVVLPSDILEKIEPIDIA
ncbi:MAG: hypothetical protein V1867_01980 [Candidatus Falkowbacteria bacterium]